MLYLGLNLLSLVHTLHLDRANVDSYTQSKIQLDIYLLWDDLHFQSVRLICTKGK